MTDTKKLDKAVLRRVQGMKDEKKEQKAKAEEKKSSPLFAVGGSAPRRERRHSEDLDLFFE